MNQCIYSKNHSKRKSNCLSVSLSAMILLMIKSMCLLGKIVANDSSCTCRVFRTKFPPYLNQYSYIHFREAIPN